ncbi:OmpA family protein [Roseibium denhamense]|uniref:Outer membrane protein OmpA n=1 Tax=Roseibium denhamense TaxID=76305 RepID=A0ABY1NRT5_9HYPH|nr:OmpA family protein [Roseibium denhamense]MTI08032.1 OmpA family protein [Roseibium denhamense]SMP15664.1 Outer membrane protein OmpA [Roseibium denhamense]
MTSANRQISQASRRPKRPGILMASLAASIAATMAVASPEPVLAQDTTYSADDVTRHFKQLKTRSLKPTGQTRALCIGTRDECSPGGAASPETGQIAVKPDGGTAGNAGTGDTAAATPDPETNAIGEGFNLLVSFEYASARLSPTAQANLREFAKGISDPDLEAAKFVIEGHTDGIGSASYNQRLSEDRASAVTEYLVSLGVGRDRLKTIAYGESRPKVADKYDPVNRRVESRLVLE